MINMSITNRGVTRLSLFALALVGVLGVKSYCYAKAADEAQRAVVNNYSRAVEDLAGSCENLSATLEKQLYAGSGEMQQKLAVELYREASAAKASLSQLPVAELNLENTYKFLSQVGNYSLSLSNKLMQGEKLTDEEYRSLSSLYDFSKKLSEDMWELEGSVTGGEISLAEIKGLSSEKQIPYVTEGFSDFEGNFDNYPTLIYDGPFSDNILERAPRMTENAATVSRDKALSKAAMALDISPSALAVIEDVEGKMPAWRFSDKDGIVFCEVTKQGGYVSYFLNMRTADRSKLSSIDAENKAKEFLEGLGILSMETTYYEIQNNIMTVNFAYSDLGKRVYPDLVKVSVAMDNGDITGYDARGFLVNHTHRSYSENLISPARAQEEVSPRLTVSSNRLAVIPTDGMNEKLCYEFTCKAKNGRNVLVYINAENAKEEQVLILIESESGVLAQ